MAASKPRAVVSGGAGFIGSHLCESLLDRGCRVLALDNFITGSADNLKALRSNPDFEFRRMDINHGIFIGGDVRYALVRFFLVIIVLSPCIPVRPSR